MIFMEKDIKNQVELKNLIEDKNYIIYTLSEVKIGERAREDILEDKFDEWLEARFFNDESEIHYFEYEGTKRVVQLTDENQDEFFLEEHLLQGTEFEKVQIKKYIGYEEEYGQAYISASRPCKLIRRNANDK